MVRFSLVVGIGLNINQSDFKDLPKAGSLFSITGKVFDKEAILTAVLERLKLNLALLQSSDYENFGRFMTPMLFRKGIESFF